MVCRNSKWKSCHILSGENWYILFCSVPQGIQQMYRCWARNCYNYKTCILFLRELWNFQHTLESWTLKRKKKNPYAWRTIAYRMVSWIIYCSKSIIKKYSTTNKTLKKHCKSERYQKQNCWSSKFVGFFFFLSLFSFFFFLT